MRRYIRILSRFSPLEILFMRRGIVKFLMGLSLFLFAISITEFIPAQEQQGSQIIESLEFRNVDIKDILRQLAKQYELNIVFSESVTGLVTVQLSNVSIQQALDSIITINGFAYTKKDNVYKVTTPQEAEREGKMSKLFRLNNADAEKLKITLKNVLTAEGSIESDVRSNSVIVTDIPGVINKIEEMLPDLDSITPQVLIEAKLIETSLTDTEALGIDWTTTISATGSERPTTFPFKKWGSDKDMYPVPTYSSDYDATEGWTITSDFPFGGEGYFFPGMSHTLGSFPTAAASYFTFGTLDFSSLQSIFDFLKTRSDTKLIANPRIVALNNQEASIYVGNKYPIPLYERSEITGDMEIAGWDEEKVGVNLTVKPQISPDGRIKLRIKPEVSSFVGYVSERDGVNEGLITSTRTAETEVQIRSGQTVVIGGLVKYKTTDTVKKIPILGDIPLLGFLFTRKNIGSSANPREQTDLLIFVTATIIQDTDKPLIAQDSHLITSLPRPFKLELRADTAIIKEPEK